MSGTLRCPFCGNSVQPRPAIRFSVFYLPVHIANRWRMPQAPFTEKSLMVCDI